VVGFLEGPTWLTGRRIGETSSDVEGVSGSVGSIAPLIAAGVWDATPRETELLVQLDGPVGGGDDVRVIDDTAIPKKAGRAAQYASRWARPRTARPW